MTASLAGGIVAITMSYVQSGGKVEVLATINGVLGALVGITASCAIVTIWESFIIGAVGSFLANITDPLLVYLRVDDAVGATCVHGFGGAWGIIAVGIFAAKDELENYCQYDGLLHGGGGYLLGVQTLTVVTMGVWAVVVTLTLLFVSFENNQRRKKVFCVKITQSFQIIDKIIPIRMHAHEELLGADFFEHDVKHPSVGVSR